MDQKITLYFLKCGLTNSVQRISKNYIPDMANPVEFYLEFHIMQFITYNIYFQTSDIILLEANTDDVKNKKVDIAIT